MLLELTSRNAPNLIFLSLPHQKKFTRASLVVYTVILPPAGHPEDVQCTDPIAYWQARVKGALYPRLARMALDLKTTGKTP